VRRLGVFRRVVSGLFTGRCVLVEGRTESLALPELLRAGGLDVLREGVAVVPVEGVGNVAKWHRLYTALGIKCFLRVRHRLRQG
jgi:putative ATP-dependent endonuclease of the OLD family